MEAGTFSAVFSIFNKWKEPALNRSALARHVGVDRTTIINWERAGMIPAGHRISARRTMFDPLAIATAEALARTMEVQA